STPAAPRSVVPARRVPVRAALVVTVARPLWKPSVTTAPLKARRPEVPVVRPRPAASVVPVVAPALTAASATWAPRPVTRRVRPLVGPGAPALTATPVAPGVRARSSGRTPMRSATTPPPVAPRPVALVVTVAPGPTAPTEVPVETLGCRQSATATPVVWPLVGPVEPAATALAPALVVPAVRVASGTSCRPTALRWSTVARPAVPAVPAAQAARVPDSMGRGGLPAPMVRRVVPAPSVWSARRPAAWFPAAPRPVVPVVPVVPVTRPAELVVPVVSARCRRPVRAARPRVARPAGPGGAAGGTAG